MSMSDRELLELAAKAAGYKYAITATVKGGEFLGMINGHDSDGYPTFWNPLTDDGDALRLARKVGLKMCLNDDFIVSDNEGPNELHWFYDGSAEGLRSSIVRAAAEIGRAMG